MRILVLANIGNRDLEKDGKYLEKIREEGKEILDNFEKHKEKLRAPILSPTLEYIGKKNSEAKIELLMFATDQPKGSEHWESDTCYIAECLKRMWKEGLLAEEIEEKNRGGAWVRRIEKHPVYYDTLSRFYKEDLSREKVMDGYDIYYLSVTGGTPQMNFGLLFSGVELFGDKCRVVYKPIGEDPLEINIAEEIKRSVKIRIAHELIKKYEYEGASLLLRELGYSEAASLAKIAAYRLGFDFQRASFEADELRKKATSIRKFVSDLYSEFEKLRETEDIPVKVHELYFNMKVCFEKGRYVDFLGRLYRFIEAVLKLMVTKEFGISSEEEDFEENIEKYPELKEFLEKEKLRIEPNTLVLRKCLEWKWKEPKNYPPAFSKVSFLCDKLLPLRNKSIMAHGFKGVSFEEIAEALSKQDRGKEELQSYIFDELLGEGLRSLEVETAKDPFSKINGMIISLIQ